MQFASLRYFSSSMKSCIQFEGMYVVSTLCVPNLKSIVHINSLYIKFRDADVAFHFESPTNTMYSNPNTTWIVYPMFLQLEVDQSPLRTQLGIKKQ